MSEVRRYTIDPRDNIGLGTMGTNTLQFVLASDYDALRLQLSRAREWMDHGDGCPAWDWPHVNDPCTCGLTEFLKEVGP